MYIYNVTTQLTWAIQKVWLHWMQQDHIPMVVATGCFTHHRMVRLLEVDETEGPTYAVQYFTDSLVDYQRYITKYAPVLRLDGQKRWGDQCISFRSLMEVVH
jgi:hypothetical protein